MRRPPLGEHGRLASRVLLMGALLAVPSGPTAAQTDPAVDTARSGARHGPRDASPTAALLGGGIGGGLGLVGGALLGAAGCDELFCHEMIVGAVVGEVLGAALGTHTFNRGRGNLLADLGVSAGVAALGVLVASGVGRGEDGILLVAGVAQVALVTLIEVRTSPWIEPAAGVRTTPEGFAAEVGLRIR